MRSFIEATIKSKLSLLLILIRNSLIKNKSTFIGKIMPMKINLMKQEFEREIILEIP